MLDTDFDLIPGTRQDPRKKTLGSKMCIGGSAIPIHAGDKLAISNPIPENHPDRIHHNDTWGGNIRQKGIRRIRVKCSVCGRHLIASVRTCHDGCCILFSLPPHKVKHWWKRKKPSAKRSRDRQNIYHKR